MKLKPRYRQGRCYELAWKYQSRDDRFAEWTLVHGEIISPGDGKLIPHAWLKHRDKIYDPVHDETFDAEVYLAKYMAKPIASYSREAATKAAVDNGHFGPWHRREDAR